jgi:cell wall-associated NlpC family hydrolase
MLQYLKKAALLGFCLLAIVCGTPAPSAAQQAIRPTVTKFTNNFEVSDLPGEALDPKSLLLMIGAQIHETELDCSHFVQHLYEQAGLYYGYTPSRVLYTGIRDFKRVVHPKAGDLIVWRGHVGIVVDPEETTFLSALRSGVKTSSYQSTYWKKRGRPHFLRYVGVPEQTSPVWSTRNTQATRSGLNGE